MPPVHPIELAAISASNLAFDLLHPAAIEASNPMRAGAWCTGDRVTLDEARQAVFTPVQPGWRWGPVWSTAWFQLEGRLPEGDGTPAVQFSSGTEALLYLQDGRSWHGLDMHRDLVRLPAQSVGDVALHVEAACNRPLGATLFWWDPPEDHARWKEAMPGRFERANLVRLHEPTWLLAVTVDFAVRLLRKLPSTSIEAQRIVDALGRTARMVDDANVRSTSQAALDALQAALKGTPQPFDVIAVGHAHIDTAWLWPIAETRRKIRRTWATALRLMDRYDDFHFTASQAQQYAWLESDDPELFQAIAARVKEGRWEANGAMWVEPDCQIPSGESLVRQFLLGTAWWKRQFGEAARQTVLYLPDTFGFPASLPQLVVQAGLERFITNKICWNEVTVFPFVDFDWRGIDGTTVAAHFTPGHTYNAAMEPADLIGAQTNAMARGPGRTSSWLQPFGYGDGGGGPTDEMVERARLSAQCAGLPAVAMGRLDQLRRGEVTGDRAIWDGELYLEMHRGIFTTHGWLKRQHLAAEEGLRLAEVLSSTNALDRVETRRALEPAWQRLLLQQFHDILPGSSITAVYDDVRRDLAAVQAEVMSRIDGCLAPGEEAFNPASTTREGVVMTSHGLRWHDAAPPLSSVPMQADLPDRIEPVRVEGRVLDNGLLRCRIGDDGAVYELQSSNATRSIPGPLSRLCLYRDRPRRWEAWDIDREYADNPIELPGPSSIEVVEANAMQAIIEVKRDIGIASAAVQRYVLRAGSPLLEVELEIDWAESQRLLRCSFQTDIRASDARFGIQFGHIRRSAHRNTPFDEARFEVPGHRWMDLCEPGRGLAVLDRAIYGKSACHGELGLSLLRAPNFPDPEADRGTHLLHWALLPHGGDPLAGGVVAGAEVFAGREMVTGVQHVEAPFVLDVSQPAAIELAACKGAEDDRGRIIRMVEMHGAHGTATMRWPSPVRVSACDLHEQPMHLEGLEHDGTFTSVPLRPFGVITLRIEDLTA
jgi:alpha-mannosidase